jgi:FkbM family methyltransferase
MTSALDDQKFVEFGDTGIKLATDSSVSQKMIDYITRGWYEVQEFKQVEKIVEKDDVVLELGSGLGLISTVAWKTGKTKSIHCYEADPRLVPLIKRTHDANGVTNATVHNKAITSDLESLKAGTLDFHIRPDFWENSTNPEVGAAVLETIKVPVISLSEIIDSVSPTLIVADIEGAEDGLFGQGVNLRSVKRIALEIHQEMLGPAGMRRLFDDFHRAGFHYDARYSNSSVPVFSRIPDDCRDVKSLKFDLAQIVSLGDNCEFAFLQQAYGKDKESSLLRWSYIKPQMLLDALQGNFDGIFRFENLTPYASTMVKDSRYGIAFHTKMKSADGVFVDCEETRREIHKVELEKHTKLKARLLSLLGEDRLFVYKTSGPLLEQFCKDLGREISSRGSGKLLFVFDSGDAPVGVAQRLSENVVAAKIDRIAPLAHANHFSNLGWITVLNSAVDLLERM